MLSPRTISIFMSLTVTSIGFRGYCAFISFPFKSLYLLRQLFHKIDWYKNRFIALYFSTKFYFEIFVLLSRIYVKINILLLFSNRNCQLITIFGRRLVFSTFTLIFYVNLIRKRK